MSSLFIEDDGYSRRVRVAPVAGVHGELLFTMRPMLPAQVEDFEGKLDAMVRRGDHTSASKMAAARVADHITEWEVRTRKGDPVKVSAENVGRLVPNLFGKVKLIVEGARATDPRDDWSEDEREEYLATCGAADPGWLSKSRGN